MARNQALRLHSLTTNNKKDTTSRFVEKTT